MQRPAGTDQAESGQDPGRRRYRSLFWAFVLIGAGVVWLLYSIGVMDSTNLAVLGMVWPILIIGIGADILVGRRSLVAGALVGAITVGVIIGLMMVGPARGWVHEEVTVESQPGQALRVEVKSISSGKVVVPPGIVLVSGGQDGEGIWETQGYASAPFQTSIVVESMSSGDVRIIVGG